MTPEEYVQHKTASSGSSFYYAFLFLPEARRAAITAFYAFCREIDDVVDEVSDPQVAAAKLNWWRQQVLCCAPGSPQAPEHPALRALLPHMPVYQIHTGQLLQIIDGCQMDLEQSRYLDWVGLERYCHLVAGVVGEVSALIFGQTDPATTAYAHQLGQAFQLTNIVRDIGEDALRGRIYIPIQALQTAQVKAHELLKRGQGAEADFPERFAVLMRTLIERNLQLYASALQQLPSADRRSQKPGLMMASIYRTLLQEIAHDPQLVLTQRVRLTPLRKLWLAWKVQALGRL